ncbi:MAG: alpha/beta hydrolase [Cryobacterium sp.]|uniref:alpha/beta fold hydrolase n=1 Tax=unclassified Cryobacterium TaxID=2649013 RepID=UPI0018CB2C55|nr:MULTISPECIES: alpha/beta hydrolase [unclassified Cryobacterium]MCY7403522.1 alpha/beta hydrolase [Cryobacterium sp.]MEC5154786.1 pimeloyl-ACP methyl ester carboxylesterase [Cryobacterium sp. CAN_C3]
MRTLISRPATRTHSVAPLGGLDSPEPGPPPAPPKPAPPATVLGYSPFPLDADARHFSLTTSTMRLRGGTVVVRHGRRSTSDTATILLHGAAGSWTTWTPLLQAAEATARDLTDLIIPDLPGWGDSPLPSDETAPSVESMAELVADVARSLGYERWNVVGHSMGGFVALQLAASETRATTSVGLVSATSFSIQDSVRHPIRHFSVLPAFTALLLTMRMLRVAGPLGRGLVRTVAGLGLLRALVASLFSRPMAVDATVIAALGTEVRPAAFVLAATRAGAYDAATRWAQISCPVRSVHGDRDVFVTVNDDARLRAVVSHCVVSTIAGAGHFGQIERPLEVLLRLEFAVPLPTKSTTPLLDTF